MIRINRKTITLCLSLFLLSLVLAACAKKELGQKAFLPERLIAEVDFSSWIKKSLKVSPDSKRVAYVARLDDQRFMVVDGTEGAGLRRNLQRFSYLQPGQQPGGLCRPVRSLSVCGCKRERREVL